MTTSCSVPEQNAKKLTPALLLTLTGFGLFVLLLIGGAQGPDGEPFLPLLARLAICELGFITSAIAAFVGCKADWRNCRPSINSIAAVIGFVLAIYFFATGIQLWPL